MSDINRLIERCLTGDLRAREQLLIKLKPAILGAIKRYYNKPKLYEDLIQEGYVMILQGMDHFNSRRGVHFLGYIKAQLKYGFLEKNKEETDIISLNQPISTKESPLELLDTLMEPERMIEDILLNEELMRNLRTSLSSLTKRQGQVIKMYYIDNQSMKTISNQLKISYRTVVNTKTVALLKIKRQMEKKR